MKQEAFRKYSMAHHRRLHLKRIGKSLGFIIGTGISTCMLLSARIALANDYNLAEIKSVTGRVLTPADDGSGVIIGKRGNLFTALTAQHVVPGFKAGSLEEYYFIDSLGNKSRISSIVYPAGKKYDIALVQFKSPSDLPVIPLTTAITDNFFFYRGNGEEKKNFYLGFGRLENFGYVSGYSLPTKEVSISILRQNRISFRERAKGNQNGYELLYESSTIQGMSGGPVTAFNSCPFDSGGFPSLVGIHGMSEGYEASSGRSGISLAVPVDLIREYLYDNRDKFGIPFSEEEVLQAVNKVGCGKEDKIPEPASSCLVHGGDKKCPWER